MTMIRVGLKRLLKFLVSFNFERSEKLKLTRNQKELILSILNWSFLAVVIHLLIYYFLILYINGFFRF
jgi:hypothetical protein